MKNYCCILKMDSCPTLSENEILSRLGGSVPEISVSGSDRKQRLCDSLMHHLQNESDNAHYDNSEFLQTRDNTTPGKRFKNNEEVITCMRNVIDGLEDQDMNTILTEHATKLMQCMNTYKKTTRMQRVVECIQNDLNRLPSESLMMYLKFLNSSVRQHNGNSVIPCAANSVFILTGENLEQQDSNENIKKVVFVTFNPIRTRSNSKREVDHLNQAEVTRKGIHYDALFGSDVTQNDVMNSASYTSPYFTSSWKNGVEFTKHSFKYNHLRIYCFEFDESRTSTRNVKNIVQFVKQFGRVSEFHQDEFNPSLRASRYSEDNTDFDEMDYDTTVRKLMRYSIGQSTGLGRTGWFHSWFNKQNDGLKWYYLDDTEGMAMHGPYTTQKMRKYKNNGTINDSTSVAKTNSDTTKPSTFSHLFYFTEFLGDYNDADIVDTPQIQRVKNWTAIKNSHEIDNLAKFYDDVSQWCKFWLHRKKVESLPIDLELKYGLLLRETAQKDLYDEVHIIKYKRFKEYIFYSGKRNINIDTYEFTMFRGGMTTSEQSVATGAATAMVTSAVTAVQLSVAIAEFLLSMFNNFARSQLTGTSTGGFLPTREYDTSQGQDAPRKIMRLRVSEFNTQHGVLTALKSGFGIFSSIGSFIITLFVVLIRCSWLKLPHNASIESFYDRDIDEFDDKIEFVIFTESSKNSIFASDSFWSKPVSNSVKHGIKILSNAKQFVRSYASATTNERYYYKDDGDELGPFTIDDIFKMYKNQTIDGDTPIAVCNDNICPHIGSHNPYDEPMMNLQQTYSFNNEPAPEFHPLNTFESITMYAEWYYHGWKAPYIYGWNGPYNTNYISHLLRTGKINKGTTLKKQTFALQDGHIGKKQELIKAAGDFNEKDCNINCINHDKDRDRDAAFCNQSDVRDSLFPAILSRLVRGFTNMKDLKTNFRESVDIYDNLTPPNPIISTVINDQHLLISSLKKQGVYKTYKNLSWMPHCVEFGGSFCPNTIFTNSNHLRVQIDKDAYYEFETNAVLNLMQFKNDLWDNPLARLGGRDPVYLNRVPKKYVLQAASAVLDTTQALVDQIDAFELQLPDSFKLVYMIGMNKIERNAERLIHYTRKIYQFLDKTVFYVTGGGVPLLRDQRKVLKRVVYSVLEKAANASVNASFKLGDILTQILQIMAEKYPELLGKMTDISETALRLARQSTEAWHNGFIAWGTSNFNTYDMAKDMMVQALKQGDSMISNIYQDNWSHVIFQSKTKRWETIRLNFMAFYNTRSSDIQASMKTMMYVFLPEAPFYEGRQYDLVSLGLTYQEHVLKHFPLLGTVVEKAFRHFSSIFMSMAAKLLEATLYNTSRSLTFGYYPMQMKSDHIVQQLGNLPQYVPGIARYLMWNNMKQTWDWSDKHGPLVLGNKMYKDTLSDSFDPDLIAQIAPFPIANSDYSKVVDHFTRGLSENGHILKTNYLHEIFNTTVFSIKYDSYIRGYSKVLQMGALKPSEEHTEGYISDIKNPYVPLLKDIRSGVAVGGISYIFLIPKIKRLLYTINDNATSLFLSVYIATMTNNTTQAPESAELFDNIKNAAAIQGQDEIQMLIDGIKKTIDKYMSLEGLLYILRFVTLFANHIFVNMIFEFTVTSNPLNGIRPSEGPFLQLQAYKLSDTLEYTPVPYHEQKNGIQWIQHCVETVNKRYSNTGPKLGLTEDDIGKEIEIDYENNIARIYDGLKNTGINDLSRTYYDITVLTKSSNALNTLGTSTSTIKKVGRGQSYNGTVELDNGIVFLNPRCIVDYGQIVNVHHVYERVEDSWLPEPVVQMEPIVDLATVQKFASQMEYAMYCELNIEDVPLCSIPLPLSLIELVQNNVEFHPTTYASHFLECKTVDQNLTENNTMKYMLRSHTTTEVVLGTDNAIKLGLHTALTSNHGKYEWWQTFGKLYVKHVETGALYICRQVQDIKHLLTKSKRQIEATTQRLKTIEIQQDQSHRRWKEIDSPTNSSSVIDDDTFIEEYNVPKVSRIGQIITLRKGYEQDKRLHRQNGVVKCDNRYFKKINENAILTDKESADIKTLEEEFSLMMEFWSNKLDDASSPFILDGKPSVISLNTTPSLLSHNGVIYTNFVNLTHQMSEAEDFIAKLNLNYTDMENISVFETNGQEIMQPIEMIRTRDDEYYNDDSELIFLLRFAQHQQFRLKMLYYYNEFVTKISQFKTVLELSKTGVYYMKFFHVLPLALAGSASISGHLRSKLGSEKHIFTTPSGDIVTPEDAYAEANTIKLSLTPVDPVTAQPDVIVPNLLHKFAPHSSDDQSTLKEGIQKGLSLVFPIVHGLGQQILEKTKWMKSHAKSMFKTHMEKMETLSFNVMT